jgi:hypothetical protein
MSRLLLLFALLVPVGAAVVETAAAADDPSGFVRNRVALNQSMTALLSGRFVVEAKCAEGCTMSTRLVMASPDAIAAGFKGVKPGTWFEIGRVTDLQLTGGKWTRVQIPLTATARRVLGKSDDGVKFAGQTIAKSLVSGRYGQASWIRTCKWPR